MNAIEIENLYYSYFNLGSETPILNNLSLKVRAGEFVAIQGPSGSGKSTLLYILGLLAAPKAGKFRLFEQDVAGLSEDELADKRSQNIGFVFQQFHLLPKTSVIENILLPTQYSSKQKNKAELIEKAKFYAKLVNLADRFNNHPNQLSGGQQQRVAICRALMNDPELILADEPTGNLDSASAIQILELLKRLNREMNKTVVIITHDDEVAKKADRIIKIKDGQIVADVAISPSPEVTSISSTEAFKKPLEKMDLVNLINSVKTALPSALANLKRNVTRTTLTMLGISVGIAAVLSMNTFGQFTKDKILAGYAELGVNTITFYGRTNWEQKATDVVPTPFRSFSWENDLEPLRTIFPEIQRISPVMVGWDGAVDYGGRSMEQDITIIGSSEDALLMSRRSILLGRNFSKVEIEQKSGVCIVGYEIAERLFSNVIPIGEVLRVSQGSNSYGCRIIGVLKNSVSNKEYMKPNLQVIIPFTFFQAQAGDWWSSQIREVMLQADIGSDVEKIGKGIRTFFEQRYGSSGRFRVDSDTVLVAQMRRFLSLFTLLLSSIALVTLAVGGIGITNMMLVSVSERFREIGVRKALGARNNEIRMQFLVESVIVCLIAGLIGIIVGFAGYHSAIWVSTKFVNKLQFEWIVNWFALFLSLISILVVGILSGLFPAMKAEKLQVIDALRSE